MPRDCRVLLAIAVALTPWSLVALWVVVRIRRAIRQGRVSPSWLRERVGREGRE